MGALRHDPGFPRGLLAGHTGPLGGDDLRSLAAAVEYAATPGRRRYGLTTPVTVYTAVVPRLRGFPGATELLRGVGYAAAVCRANVALADVVQGDSDQGLFENGSRITLDDPFEGGGVWPSHHPGDAEAPGDPLTPAGRGWTSTLPAPSEQEPEVELDPVDLPLADDASLGTGELLRNDAQETVWRAPLRLAHLVGGWLPLHPYVVEDLCRSHGARRTVRLELDHAGEALDEKGAVQDVTAEIGDDSGRLTRIAWPRDFFPGLMLELRRSHGGTVIRLATTRLKEHVQVGDRETGHCYDPRVLTREDAPGSDRRGHARPLTVRRCAWPSSLRQCPADHVTFRLVARWVGHGSGGSDESRVVASGATPAAVGQSGRSVARPPHRAQRHPVPGPHRRPVA